MAGERLQTVIARAGLGSRRAADRWIAEGRVRVNGTPAAPGTRIDPALDEVTLDGQPLTLDAPAAIYLAVHKPRGILSSARPAHGRRSVVELVHVPRGTRLWPAGRLDADSEGLMLLTNDGTWAQRVLHPRFGLEREYAVQLDRRPSDADLARLRTGVTLEDRAARLLGTRRGRRPLEIATGADERADGPWVTVRLGEGRNREVRRLFAAVGYRVHRLVRIRFGSVSLAGLAAGDSRPLSEEEVTTLDGSVPLQASTRGRQRRTLQVAVDGTSGSGKSTVGRALAQRIGARFVDTGLLYRAVTLATLEAGIDPADSAAVARVAREIKIKVRAADPASQEAGERVTVSRKDVTRLLREPRIERAVPIVSQHADVRAAMLTVQREAARGGDTVMVGRDIGTVVLPGADLKVFLTASVETRARRRAAQMGRPDRLGTYLREITERDRTDSGRAVAPLRRAPGALVLDTGEMDVDASVDAIVAALPASRPQ